MVAGNVGNDKISEFKKNESENPIYDENLSEGAGSMAIQKANE